MRKALAWLQARADNVSAALLAAMFAAFILQIFTRYVINNPLSWTQEVCVTTWLWLVLWGSAFSLNEHDQVRFDVLYTWVGRPTRRWFAIASAAALFAGFASVLPGLARLHHLLQDQEEPDDRHPARRRVLRLCDFRRRRDRAQRL